MSTCPACSSPASEDQRFCAQCGTGLGLEESPTGTAPRPLVPRPDSPSPPRGSSTPRWTRASDPLARPGERFAPGTVLGGRYRIVGLLGRGGMGEVYRADDLKLEQPVALKFLPRALEGDPERLERLYGEVRMARQVSHPAVCRVWDVGEAEGQHFLSMEFVDGENLASLLRRIGRLPQDKALDIARQVAAGLAAAHEKGVLHRDLKPANVMLDGQGKVRLTDFGLAGLAEALSGDDVRSGTPSYMSPEQLQGREVTARSDIYALGLLIYELVTGRRAFEGKGLAELARKHRDERPADPSALVPDLDPAVERTILACLEKDPKRRPPSALVVSAMLSGRDPLAAAIAAGETPSPELVAAAGETEGLSPRAAWACLLVVVLGALLLPATQGRRLLLARIPVEKSPEALEDRARDLLARLVPGALAVDSEVGFSQDGDYLLWAQAQDRSAGRWASLGTGDPPVLSFWYRQSPRPLAPSSLPGVVGWNDPPARVADMAGAAYDLQGRLQSFYAVPPQRERESGPSPEPDWAPLFAEARLDLSQFRPVEPRWTPPHHSDARAAWEGAWPRRPEITLRVEAAAYRGRPVWFETVNPWTRPEREQPFPFTAGQRGMQAFAAIVFATLVAAGGLLAYRNIRLGRGDRRGAFRLATGARGAGRRLLGPAGPPRARARRRARPVRQGGGNRGAGGGSPLALLPRPRALRPTPPALDARLLGAPARGRDARRRGGPRRPHRPGVGHRARPARRPRSRVRRVAGPAGAAPRAARDRRPPLDAPAAELRRRPSRERDPPGPGPPAALPRAPAGDPSGPGRRRPRRRVSRLRRPGRLEGERLADAALRDRGLVGLRRRDAALRRPGRDHRDPHREPAHVPAARLRARELDGRRHPRDPPAAPRPGGPGLPLGGRRALGAPPLPRPGRPSSGPR